MNDRATHPCSRTQRDIRRALAKFEGMPTSPIAGFRPDTLHVTSLLPNATASIEIVVAARQRESQRAFDLAKLEFCGNVTVVRPYDGADGTLVYDRFHHRFQRIFGGVLLGRQAILLADEAAGIEVAVRRSSNVSDLCHD